MVLGSNGPVQQKKAINDFGQFGDCLYRVGGTGYGHEVEGGINLIIVLGRRLVGYLSHER